MKQVHITVFGANGRVGRLVVKEALRRGYEVTAFVHRESDLLPSGRVQMVQGDVYDYAAVESAISGSSAVISALGSWGTPGKDVLSRGMGNIILAMEELGVRRLVSLTGAEARASGDSLGLMHRATHFMLGTIAKKILVDSERHLQLLEDSALDWTVVRSPVMTGRNIHGRYELGGTRPAPWTTVSRSAVALSLVDQVDDAGWYGKAPFIS